MRELLEKMLRADEQMHTGEWGFVDPSGRRITNVGDHESYAVKYLEKHNLPYSKYGVAIIAKFLKVSGYVRYYIENKEVGLTIANSVSPLQVSEFRKMCGRDKNVWFDVVDEDGDTIEYGKGVSNLISTLKNMNLLEKKLRVEESSIDYPQKDLDLSVWNKDNKEYYLGKVYYLKPEVKSKILELVKKYPKVSLFDIMEDIHIVGSSCTNLFLDESDIDVHIIPKNSKDWSEESTQEVRTWFNKNRDELDGYISGHPIEIYIQIDPNQDLLSDGCYNLLKDEWLVGPKIVSENYDPYSDFSSVIKDVKDVVEDADILFGELKRDVIDYDVIKSALERMTGRAKRNLLQRLQDKLKEIEEDIEALYKKREEWVLLRHNASKPKTPEQALKDVELVKKWKNINALFKFIDRYKYLKVIKDLQELLEDDDKITPDEVDTIKDIMGVKNG